MKFKPIISIAAILTVAATSAAPLPFTPDCTASAVETGTRIAEANNIELSSDAAAAALTVLNNANGGILPDIEFTEDSNAGMINGLISGQSVTNKREAKAAVRKIAGLLGVTDFDSELRFDECTESSYNDIYSFCQLYRGIPVESGYVSLVVSKDSRKAEYLSSSFAAGLSLDTEPAVSADTARAIIRSAAGTGALETPELVIRRTEDGAYKLAWRGFTGNADAEVVYVDAQTGGLLTKLTQDQFRFQYSIAGTQNPITGTGFFSVEMDTCTYNGQMNYRLHDGTRNIWIQNDPNNTDYLMSVAWYDKGEDYIRSHPFYFENNYTWWIEQYAVKSPTPFSVTDISLGVAYQVQRAYNFYDNLFDWAGTDGQGSALIVNAESYAGTGASKYGNFIHFYKPRNYNGTTPLDAKAFDCVVHEYTHRVTGSKVKWDMSSQVSEAGALNEGYSDIMGEFADTRDWKVGAILGTPLRDCTLSPSSGKILLEWSSNPAWRRYQYYNYKAYADDLYNWYTSGYSVDCHDASTIISHAAYLMCQYGIPWTLAREIWYASMDYLPKGADIATFNSCRNAVVNNALNVVLNRHTGDYSATLRNNFKVYTRTAFNAVGIKLSYRKMGDVDWDGRVTADDATFIERYINGSISLDVESRALADVNYDGMITSADATKIRQAVQHGTTGSL